MDQLSEHAKLDFTLHLRDCVKNILTEWKRPPGKRAALTFFLENNFPFVNLQVQKILQERNPHSMKATPDLKNNPEYPIEAYLLAEAIGWIACGDKGPISTLFPLTELSEFYFLHDLKWFSRLLVAISTAIEKQIRINPEASMAILLQTWCLNKPKSPKQWLEGETILNELKEKNKKPDVINRKRIPVDAAQENSRRRRIFNPWASCWEAELRSLNTQIEHRMR